MSPEMLVGKEHIFPQIQEQIGAVGTFGRDCHKLVKPAPVALLDLIVEVLVASDVAEQLFATFLANGHCRPHCVRRAWD